MPLSGGVYTRTDGVYSGTTVFQQEAAANIDILAANLDAEANDMATALSTAMYKDGQQILTANIPFAGFKITGYGTGSAPSARSDVPQYGQVQDGAAQWAGTFGGSANTLTCSLTPILTAPSVAGAMIIGIIGTSNTSTATLNPNGQGAVAINKVTASGLAVLSGNEMIAGNACTFLATGSVYVLLDGQSPGTLGFGNDAVFVQAFS